MRPIKGKNSVHVDRARCDEIREEMGLSQDEIAAKCGRTGGWYSGLKNKPTTIFAAQLLADVLGVPLEEITFDPNAPKEPEQTEMEIPVADELTDDLAKTATAAMVIQNAIMRKTVEAINERGAEIAFALGRIAVYLETIAEAQTARDISEISVDNINAAEELLRTMTDATGECNAKKFADACDSRGISAAERTRAADNIGAQYQWRTNGNGTRKAYIVRGC